MNQSEVNQKDEELLHGRFTGTKNFSNFPRLRQRRNVGINSKYVQSESVSQKHILRLEQKFIFSSIGSFLRNKFLFPCKIVTF